MNEEKDYLDELIEARAAVDPAFALAHLRMNLVFRLLPLRKAQGLTQKDVAMRMGAPKSRVAKIESYPHRASLDHIAAYALALGARLDVILPEGVCAA